MLPRYLPNDLEEISESIILPMPERRPTEIHDFEKLQNASDHIENQFLTLLMTPVYFLNDPTIILSILFFMIFIILKKCVCVSDDPVVAQENYSYHRQEHQELCGLMSRMIHLMNLITR